jgi:hypothetical protein
MSGILTFNHHYTIILKPVPRGKYLFWKSFLSTQSFIIHCCRLQRKQANHIGDQITVKCFILVAECCSPWSQLESAGSGLSVRVCCLVMRFVSNLWTSKCENLKMCFHWNSEHRISMSLLVRAGIQHYDFSRTMLRYCWSSSDQETQNPYSAMSWSTKPPSVFKHISLSESELKWRPQEQVSHITTLKMTSTSAFMTAHRNWFRVCSM